MKAQAKTTAPQEQQNHIVMSTCSVTLEIAGGQDLSSLKNCSTSQDHGSEKAKGNKDKKDEPKEKKDKEKEKRVK